MGVIKGSAQERQILEGVIVVDSIKDAVGIHIVNLNANKGTTSDSKGEFAIPSKSGDTLFISSLQFEHKTIIVQQSFFEEKLQVKLVEKFNELDEVRLDDIRLSGVLSEDINKVPKSVYEKYGLPFPRKPRTSLELAVQSATGGGPLLSMINRLNGTTKKLEQAERNNELSNSVRKGHALLGTAFFVSQLEISEDEIENFLYFSSEDPEYTSLLNSENVLKLIQLLETKIEAFKELRGLE